MMLRNLLLATTVAVAPLVISACAHVGAGAPVSETSIPQPPAGPAYRDASLSAEARAADLVSRMTLEEKADQLSNFAPAIPRLGVPAYNWWNEGLHGVARAGTATVFPQAIGMAATWNPALMHQTAEVISTEFRAKFKERVGPDGSADWYRGLTVWSPNINIFRDPRWGRGQETYGEDPYLTSRIGIAFIQGLQGDDPKYFKTIATSKHYAVHSGPEDGRHKQDFHPTPYDLEDTYLPAFRATVTEGRAYSIMCAYNALYGVPACASPFLMQERLREDWGFKGYVVSDCGAAANIYRDDSLDYVENEERAVKVGFEAGMDLICGDYRQDWTAEQDHIVKAVQSGVVDIAVIDRALTRLFVARMRLGLFDSPESLPWADIKATDYDTPEHNALALKMAQQSMVLLKNQGNLLPLKAAPRRIAVIGPNADSLDALIGNYYGSPSKPVTVLDGIRARFPQSQVVYAQGTGLVGPAETPVPDAVLCAERPGRRCATPGLKAEHFDGVALSGAPRTTAIEPNATVTWDNQDRETSTRWTGFITAQQSGDYRFRFASQNGYRVYIDDKLIVDEWGVGDAPSTSSGKVALRRGQTYAIKVEGFQRAVRGEQQLVWSTPSSTGDDAVRAARAADLVVFVGGLSARIEGEEMKVEAEGFAGGDRTNIELPKAQQALLQRLQATGRPIVFVSMSGSALGVNWADRNIPAIVQAWYPGQQGGAAVAGLLAGDYSPAGRLPVTFYRSVADLPAFTDYTMKNRTYRYYTGEALYPFGYGLSYTTFAYGEPKLSSPSVTAGQSLKVSVDVTNKGSVASDEVVQLYVSHPGVDPAPIRALKGFDRIHLLPGETKTVTLTLDDRALSSVDAQGVRAVRPGTVRLWVGGGQPSVRRGLSRPAGAAATLTITGQSMTLPK